jgi:hypothetical protein
MFAKTTDVVEYLVRRGVDVNESVMGCTAWDEIFLNEDADAVVSNYLMRIGGGVSTFVTDDLKEMQDTLVERLLCTKYGLQSMLTNCNATIAEERVISIILGFIAHSLVPRHTVN